MHSDKPATGSRTTIVRVTIFLASIMQCAMIWGCGSPHEKKEEPKVVAVIGGRSITADLLERYFYENLNGMFTLFSFKDFEQEEHDINRVKSRLFEDFLEAQLILGEAIKGGVTVSEQEVQEFLKEFGGEDVAERKRARKESIDTVKDFLLIQKFKSEKLFPDVSVSESELKQYYDEKAKTMTSAQKITLSIIQTETEGEARELLKKIKRGGDRFENHAEKYASIMKRKDPETYDVNDLPENIRAEAQKMKVGQISPVLPLLGQFIIFRIERIEKEGIKPFEEVAGSLKERLLREKLHMLFDQYMRDLKSRTKTEIFYQNLPFTFIQGDQEGR